MNSRYHSGIAAKIAVSLIFGVLTYLLAQLINIDQPTTILMTLLVAGVVAVIQFLIDLENLARERESAQRVLFEQFSSDVALRVNKINEATELFGLVEASAIRSDEVTQLIRHSTRVSPNAPLVVVGLVQAEIARVSMLLKELADGSDVTYDGEDRDWLLELTQSATRSIDALSLTIVDTDDRGWIDGGLWMTDLGQRYLTAQSDAIRRGVSVRRVFILDRADRVEDAGFQQIVEQQRTVGVETRYIDSEALALRRSGQNDFVLFDESVSYEVTPASRPPSGWRPVIINTRLVTRPSRVDERIQRFADLWSASHTLG